MPLNNPPFPNSPPGSPNGKFPPAKSCSPASTKSLAWTEKSTPSSAGMRRMRSPRPMPLDKEIASGTTHSQKPLLGIPVAIKDVMAVKNQPLNCASKILGKFISPYDATVIEKLKVGRRDCFWPAATWTNLPWAVRRKIPLLASRIIRGTSNEFPAARPVARRRRSRRMKPSRHSARTPAARSASLRRFAAWWD